MTVGKYLVLCFKFRVKTYYYVGNLIIWCQKINFYIIVFFFKRTFVKTGDYILGEFQGVFFIFIPIFRCCLLCLKLTSFVLYV
ncbi:hypothetical protein Hanom_Chr15g01409521 [Helianthus anomalus]